jgi:hypothetical protein
LKKSVEEIGRLGNREDGGSPHKTAAQQRISKSRGGAAYGTDFGSSELLRLAAPQLLYRRRPSYCAEAGPGWALRAATLAAGGARAPVQGRDQGGLCVQRRLQPAAPELLCRRRPSSCAGAGPEWASRAATLAAGGA